MKLKYGSEIEVDGVTYVLVDVRVLKRLTGQTHNNSFCRFCAFCPVHIETLTCPRRTDGDFICKDRVNGVFVKKLEV